MFYTSNVEFYLFREGGFARFVDNLSHIPHAERALIIRSVFGGGGGFGGGSVSQTQPVPDCWTASRAAVTTSIGKSCGSGVEGTEKGRRFTTEQRSSGDQTEKTVPLNQIGADGGEVFSVRLRWICCFRL